MRRGFSLIEALVALSVLTLMLTVGLMTSRNSSRSPGTSRELAKTLAERLSLARVRAQATGGPVAFAVPSAEGTVPHSQSCYFLSGLDQPRVLRVFDDSEEFSRVVTFVGLWNGPENTLQPPQHSTEYEKVDFTRWFQGQDYQFVFTPSGRVVTNNLPLFNDEYHLVVCSGVQFSATSAPDTPPQTLSSEPSYFSLSRVADPYTIILSTSGDIRVERGLPDWSGTADIDLTTDVPPSDPPLTPDQDTSAPEALVLEIVPSQEAALLPPNTDAVVRQGEFLTIQVSAERTGGGPLYGRIEVQDPQGEPAGAFTAPSEQRMEWKAADEKWEFVSIWSPPPEHPVGTRYTITAEVEDRLGNQVAIAGSAALIVEKTDGGRFLMQSTENLGPAFLAVVNDDGTQYRRLPQDLDVLSGQIPLHFSPDRQSGVFKDTHGNTVTVDLETATLERVPHTNAWSWHHSSLTPEGSRFLVSHYQSGSPGETRFFVYHTYSGDQQRIYPSLGTSDRLYNDIIVSPDGRKVAYIYEEHDPGFGDNRVVVEDWDQTTNTLQNPTVVLTLASFMHLMDIAFSPDSSKLLIASDGPRTFRIADLVNGTLTTLNHTPEPYSHPQAFDWSPDGSRIAYYTDNDSIVIVEIANGQTTSVEIPDPALDARYLRWSR